MFSDSKSPLRQILTAQEVLVSGAIKMPCFETKRGYSFSHCLNPAKRVSATKSGRISLRATDFTPILQEFLFKVPEVFPAKKSKRFWAGT